MIGDKRTKEYSGHARPREHFTRRVQPHLPGHLVQVILALFVQVPDRLYFVRLRDVAQFR